MQEESVVRHLRTRGSENELALGGIDIVGGAALTRIIAAPLLTVIIRGRSSESLPARDALSPVAAHGARQRVLPEAAQRG